MDVDELLQHHGVDTDLLDPAPPRPTWREMRDHRALLPGCVVCGDACLSSWVVDVGNGPRWVGLCRAHTPGVLSELAAPTVLGGREGAVHG
ncbi:hypothetical protein GCM10022206_53360 [Streptomyces chiangmaiensis]